jgi:hypothetical protein
MMLTVRSKKIKKIEKAVFNTLQLAIRKYLAVSNVITMVIVIINYRLLKFAITICSL